jgi:hypothetical protein
MDEGRKRVLVIAATILVSRHLRTENELLGYRASPHTESLISSAIRIAARIMDKIDKADS